MFERSLNKIKVLWELQLGRQLDVALRAQKLFNRPLLNSSFEVREPKERVRGKQFLLGGDDGFGNFKIVISYDRLLNLILLLEMLLLREYLIEAGRLIVLFLLRNRFF